MRGSLGNKKRHTFAACLTLLVIGLLAPLSGQAATGALIPVLEALLSLRARVLAAAPAPITRVESGGVLKIGSRGPRVLRLNARLAELGYATAFSGERFDANTDIAVRAFQATAGIAIDGIVDEQTRFNLDLSDSDKMHLLAAQFEQMEKFFADRSGDQRFIVVNIPSYRLIAYEDGHPVLDSRVIVGGPGRQTPLMGTRLTGIMLNPGWAPPPTILAKDVFRNGEIDVKTVSRLGLRLVDPAGKTISLQGAVTAADLAAGGYRFFQPPGERNAMGRIKFELDNALNIYLHDTNHRELFGRHQRALSSGCVRVEEFLPLAAWVLRRAPGDIEAELRDRRTRRLPVDPVAVYFVYWLADVADGRVVYHRDIYARNSRRGLFPGR